MSPALRLVVKDAIDVEGTVTGVGCRAVAEHALPAEVDAACVAGFRTAGAQLVGKATLDELCITASGRNDWLGTPPNPLDASRAVGGSSSGSAVAVAVGTADIALGTDTGGSVRVPAACCGVVGLKTTWGRVPLHGVWPTAPTLDTVGPLARDVAGVAHAMSLLVPDWQPATPPSRVGRLRVGRTSSDVEAAVDAALQRAGFEVVEVRLDGWDGSAAAPFDAIFLREFWQHHRGLLDRDGIGRHVVRALRAGSEVTADDLAVAMRDRALWQDEVDAALELVDVIALPTLSSAVPTLHELKGYPTTRLTAPLNVAGVPALSLPVAAVGDSMPMSMQLFARAGGEELLCATGAVVEATR